MRFFIAAAVLVAAAVSAQSTITVLVGDQGQNTFSPNSITARTGDTVVFQFMTKNHTVTQSTFAEPCKIQTSPSPGVDSGFVPVDVNSGQIPQWSFEITNTSAPLWFYCRQTGHCGQGMVFAINPTADKSFDAFQAKAKSSASSATSSGFITLTSQTSTATSSSASSTDKSSSASRKVMAGRAGALALVGAVTVAMI